MQRNQTTLTLSVPPGTKERLAAIAERLGLRWGEQPSPSKLVAAVADGTVPVGTPLGLTGAQSDALLQAVKALHDAGRVAEVRELAPLLTAVGPLDPAQRMAVYAELSRSEMPFRGVIEDAIARQTPVVFQYVGLRGVPSQYLARHVKLTIRERRWYVDIYTDDKPSNDVAALAHNRCLRLDKVVSALPVPHTEPWVSALDAIEAKLRLFGEDARFYEPHDDDVDVGEVIEGPEGAERTVTRRVAFSWWFIRDILRHGRACKVEGPPDLVHVVAAHLREAAARYA
ncbi:MAG: WYL domain-containing protein [Candidatus Sericytochromatia bacterium]|nr:WYL domain-containing protein [Candidatus Sericytochromatia bacterium]